MSLPTLTVDPSDVSNAAQFSKKPESSNSLLRHQNTIRDEARRRHKEDS